MGKRIIQTGIGLDEITLQRCDRLRACFGRSRSWVIEQAISNGGLDVLERERAGEIRRFEGLAAAAGVTWQEYLKRYLAEFGAKTLPPSVEELEKIQFTGEKSLRDARRAGQERAVAALRKVTQAQVPLESVESAEKVAHPPLRLRDLR